MNEIDRAFLANARGYLSKAEVMDKLAAALTFDVRLFKNAAEDNDYILVTATDDTHFRVRANRLTREPVDMAVRFEILSTDGQAIALTIIGTTDAWRVKSAGQDTITVDDKALYRAFIQWCGHMSKPLLGEIMSQISIAKGIPTITQDNELVEPTQKLFDRPRSRFSRMPL